MARHKTLECFGTGGGSGFDSDDCNCQSLVSGWKTLLSSPTVCCEGHERLSANFGELGDHTLIHQGGDIWSTFSEDEDLDNPVEIGCCPITTTSATTTSATTTSGVTTTCEEVTDKYDLVLTVGESNSSIVLTAREGETGNCDPVCAEFEHTGSFKCKGSNRFHLTKFEGIAGISECVCLSPEPTTFGGDCCVEVQAGETLPDRLQMTVTGLADGDCDCDNCESINDVSFILYRRDISNYEFGNCYWTTSAEAGVTGNHCDYGGGAQSCEVTRAVLIVHDEPCNRRLLMWIGNTASLVSATKVSGCGSCPVEGFYPGSPLVLGANDYSPYLNVGCNASNAVFTVVALGEDDEIVSSGHCDTCEEEPPTTTQEPTTTGVTTTSVTTTTGATTTSGTTTTEAPVDCADSDGVLYLCQSSGEWIALTEGCSGDCDVMGEVCQPDESLLIDCDALTEGTISEISCDCGVPITTTQAPTTTSVTTTTGVTTTAAVTTTLPETSAP